ncbi:MAG: BREX system Lon protease-like protein BrxL [Chloroflexi bacterium]|nr:MAG: BREX system Lon protease-like protein BrxL [Chloroflexota bacterium]
MTLDQSFYPEVPDLKGNVHREEAAYEALVRDAFAEVAIEKSISRELRLEDQGIPTFVAEWLIDREQRRAAGGSLEDVRKNIHAFIREHLPRKEQKEVLRNRLSNGEVLRILDNFRVTVDLKKNRRRLIIPSLDEVGEIETHLLEQFEGLLQGGLWGAGLLVYERPERTASGMGEVWLREFKPLQAADIDLGYYKEQRSRFSIEQWSALLVNSMGYNPAVYNTREQQILLLTRLLPLVQRRINLIELAPKGTGKSFVFSNLSRYARIISGGKTSPAVLFYNNSTNTPGLLTRFDVVVFDEAQTIAFDNPGEVIGILKDFMESGKYTRGNQMASSDCGVVFLGNIEIGFNGHPVRQVLFDELPSFLRETAFIDRIHGLLPGWELPKIQRDSPARQLALKADYFGEVLHRLRNDGAYDAFVSTHVKLVGSGSENMRNSNAIQRLAAGYLKLFFPDLQAKPHEFETYCLRPAIRLRQIICDQLSILDSEYKPASIEGTFHA